MTDIARAAELDRTITAALKEREREVARLYKEHTGRELPELISFRAEDGSLYAIEVHARLRLVKREFEV